MPLLMDAIKLLPNATNLRATKDNKVQEQRIQDLLKLNQDAKSLVGNIAELNSKIDNSLFQILEDIRLVSWRTNRTLPKNYELLHTSNGSKADQFTALNRLPKAGIAQFRNLADMMNMVIFPVDYTDIYEVFKTQPNNFSLKVHYQYITKLVETDYTTKYNIYMLAPIQYYNLWNHIKSNKDLPIYYPASLESVFTTIELMVPAQRNLYLATKANTDNIAKLAANMDNIETSLKTNIDTINNKLENVIARVNTLEAKQIELQQKQLIQEEENKKLKQQLVTAEMYMASLRNVDPIMFAVPANVNITTEDANALIMMFWGADIDEMIFKFKGIEIKPNKNNNPMNMDLDVDKLHIPIKDCNILHLAKAFKRVDNSYYTDIIDGYQLKLDAYHRTEEIGVKQATVYLYNKKIMTMELNNTVFRTTDLIATMKNSYRAEELIATIAYQFNREFDKTKFNITMEEFLHF